MHGDAVDAVPMIQRVLDALSSCTGPPSSACSEARDRQLGCCRHLKASLAAAKAHPACAALTAAFEAAEPALRWTQTSWYRKALGDEYMENYGYTNILGWEPAVWVHPTMLVGFMLIGPGWTYPQHHHEAEEVYIPLGGDTLWGQGGRPGTQREPGSVIHNISWLPHDMQTLETPMFALVLWSSPGNTTRQGGTLCAKKPIP